jgi:ribosomal protein S8E
MNTNGKKARKETGMNRHELKRATRMKRHERLGDAPYNPNIGTNARKSESRRALKRV